MAPSRCFVGQFGTRHVRAAPDTGWVLRSADADTEADPDAVDVEAGAVTALGSSPDLDASGGR